MDSANIARSRSASLPARLSPSPLPPTPALPLMVMALMTEETKRRHGGVEGVREADGDGEIWEGKQGRRRKWKDEKCWEVERSAEGRGGGGE